ncbi:MAG: hypothetical protein HY078_12425 [Elusimicrobia bacterium]|nr:hypothetical protein [Elusimicrobiota bacterium]
MNHRLIRMLFAAAALAAPAAAKDGGASGVMSDQYIEQQKHRLDETLQLRVGDIENRFAEEQSFRVKMKNERIAFEKRLVQERGTFLEGLKKVKATERPQALAAYFSRQKEKRKEFNEQRKTASRQFWEARIAARTAQRQTAR